VPFTRKCKRCKQQHTLDMFFNVDIDGFYTECRYCREGIRECDICHKEIKKSHISKIKEVYACFECMNNGVGNILEIESKRLNGG